MDNIFVQAFMKSNLLILLFSSLIIFFYNFEN